MEGSSSPDVIPTSFTPPVSAPNTGVFLASGKAGPVFLLASPALSGTGPRGWKWLKGNERRETAPRVLEGRFLDRRACPQSRKGRRQKTSVSLSFPAFHPAGTQPLAPAA